MKVTGFIEKVYEAIRENNLIDEEDTVVAAISGGPDSVCLLNALEIISHKYIKFKLEAAHLNHMLRGEESDGDERFVRQLCERMGIRLHTKSADIALHAKEKCVSTEAAAREIRYLFLNEVADKLKSPQKIAVAHNSNDQAETVLMNILRGSGSEGISGMKMKNGRIIRPLLKITRKDIEEYCSSNSIETRSDSSNFINIYTRNRLRNLVIPHIDSTLGIDSVKKINSMSSLIKDENDFLESFSAACYDECIRDGHDNLITIRLERFNEYHTAVRRRILRKAICSVRGNLTEIESVHIEDALKLLGTGRTGAVIQLPGALRILKSYDTASVYLHRNADEAAPFCTRLSVPGSTFVETLQAFVISSLYENDGCMARYKKTPHASHTQFFDYEKACPGLCIRSREKGDRFSPIGMKGTKKLKDYLIDEKIPRQERDSMPFIAAGDEIIWVIGKRTSENFKVTGETKTVLKLEYISEGETD